MSRENVELVRRIYEDWAQGRFASVELLDPEIEFVLADGPSPGRHKGLTAMAKANRDWLQAWEEVRQIPERLRELDDERVLSIHHYRARGKKSGLDLGDMRGEAAAVFHVSNGRVTRIVHYFDRGAALEALGLRE